MPSASLVPENDPSVLFNTAGMQPLVPYLLGQKHPLGDKLANIQKCVRTGDLDDIGDNRHFSFFEMMGNWSLGAYFKEDAIKWSYEFLTSKEEGLGLDPKKLYVTVFKGDENAPEDTESQSIWKSLGIPENRIYKLTAEHNWWSPGENGPCGPDTEMFYDVEGNVGDLSEEEFVKAVKDERVIEIWNDVFMEYEKKDGKVIGKLAQKNVDTGAGLERMTAVMQGKKTAYDTDIFAPIMGKIDELVNSKDLRAKRIIADHVRTAVFMISDGVTPSNSAQGYVLRRLLRRARYYFSSIGAIDIALHSLIKSIVETYKDTAYGLNEKMQKVDEIITLEETKFVTTLKSGKRAFEIKVRGKNTVEKNSNTIKSLHRVTGKDLFDLWTVHGYPVELSLELAKENDIPTGEYELHVFRELMLEHQKLSQTSSAGMFKGGLANSSEKTVKLHTAHHLLLAALQEKFGKSVKQKGSNITEERLRMDFSFDRKMTDEEKKEIEDRVNQLIEEGIPVVKREMSRDEAEKIGAEMEFGAKYPDKVSVYFVEKEDGSVISKEFCGGPHITNTKEIGKFKILKEEASSAGIRRIKATIE